MQFNQFLLLLVTPFFLLDIVSEVILVPLTTLFATPSLDVVVLDHNGRDSAPLLNAPHLIKLLQNIVFLYRNRSLRVQSKSCGQSFFYFIGFYSIYESKYYFSVKNIINRISVDKKYNSFWLKIISILYISFLFFWKWLTLEFISTVAIHILLYSFMRTCNK